MAEKILLLGKSGTGKSTSFRNMPPDETFILQCVNKRLPFKGSRKKFSLENKNLYYSKNYKNIISSIKKLNTIKKIKYIIIDDSHYLMVHDFMKRIPNKAIGGEVFERYNEIGYNFYMLLELIDSLRDDLVVVFVAHTETDEKGEKRFKTIGRMIDNKVQIEGLSTYILESNVIDGNYKFATNKQDDWDIAKTPLGMFEELHIDNDLYKVLKKIEKYYKGDDE